MDRPYRIYEQQVDKVNTKFNFYTYSESSVLVTSYNNLY